MMYYGNGMGAGGWILMSLLGFGVLVVLILAVGTAVRQATGLRQIGPAAAGPKTAEAERVLADRFAHGDIDAEEYEQRLHTLRAAGR